MAPVTPDRTPAQIAARQQARAAQLEALHERLSAQVAALRDGQDWKNWLRVAAHFHHYSVNNVLLIAAQRPDATAVASFGAWRSLGRQVGRGERGIQILAPIVRRPRSDTTPTPAAATAAAAQRSAGPDGPELPAEPAAPGRGRVSGFRVAYVFDVAQTSGRPLPQQPAPQLLVGQAPAGLWDALAAQVAERGFTLHRGDCGPEVNGLTHYGDRTVTVRADVDDAQAVKTLAHELGHVLLHDPTHPPAATLLATRLPAGDPLLAGAPALTSRRQCRGRVEVEAESVAYLVASSHGLDTGGYTFPYVAGWASTVDATTPDAVVHATAGRVLAAARVLLTATEHISADQRIERQDLARATELQQNTAPGAEQTGATTATATPLARGTRPPSGLSAGAAVLASAPSADRLVQVHALAVAFYSERLHGGGPDSRRASTLLAGRGVDQISARDARLGYAPVGWTSLVDHLRAAGVDDHELLASGLVLTSSRGTLVDRFRDRIIFPIQTAPGRTVALLGRAVDDTATDRAGAQVPKYLNSPDTIIYRKSQVLYGLSEALTALAAGATPVIVEGPMDVHAVNQAGLTTTTDGRPRFVGVATCGTALTATHVALLDQATGSLAARHLITAFDGDAAGRQAGLRAFQLLRAVNAWPYAVDLPAGQDPALLLQLQGTAVLQARLQSAIGRPLADLVVDERIDRHAAHLQWAEGQLAAARSAAAAIAALPTEHIGRQVSRVARRLSMPTSLITGHVVDAVTWRPRPSPSPARSRLSSASSEEESRTAASEPMKTATQRARTGFPTPLRTHLAAPRQPSLEIGKVHSPSSATAPSDPVLDSTAPQRVPPTPPALRGQSRSPGRAP